MEVLFQAELRTELQMVESSILGHLLFEPQNSSNFGFNLTPKLSHFTPETQRDILKCIFSTLTKGNTGKKCGNTKEGLHGMKIKPILLQILGALK